jgi:hypothetical protein
MILTLDLSRHCGWAAGALGSVPTFGVAELPACAKGEEGKQAAAYSDFLGDMIGTFSPALIVMEADCDLHKQNPTQTALQQIGMVYLTSLICFRRKVRCRSQTASDARKGVLGQSRWPQKGMAKDAVLAWCRLMKHDVTDHNAADALVLWHYSASLLSRSSSVDRALARGQ